MNPYCTPKLGHSDILYWSKSPVEKVWVNRHFQASCSSQSMGRLMTYFEARSLNEWWHKVLELYVITLQFCSRAQTTDSHWRYLLHPCREAEYCDQFVCLPRAYLWNRWTDLREILCADPLWPSLSPLLAALQYVRYFRLYRWRLVWPQWAIWRCVEGWTFNRLALAALWDGAESDVYECLVAVVGRSEDADCVGVEEIDSLQLELEILLASAAKRMRHIHNELNLLDEWIEKGTVAALSTGKDKAIAAAAATAAASQQVASRFTV